MKRSRFLIALVAVACGDDGSAFGSGGAGGSSSTTAPSGPTSSSGASGGGGGAPLETVPFVYVGTSADKIFTMLLDRATGALAPIGEIDAGESPSFLAADPGRRFLFAVDAGSDEVASFAIDPGAGTLSFRDRVSSEGAGPAHVSVDMTGRWLFVANYGSGTVASIAILSDAMLGAPASVEAPGQNAHLVRADPENDTVYVPCLGSDIVASYGFDPGTGLLAPQGPDFPIAAGGGPRHLDFHPTLPVVYVVNELGDSVTVATRDAAGELTEIQTIGTLPAGADADANYCADIHVTPDGRFVYASNRGHDSLAIFAADPATGLLSVVGHRSVAGSWPRNFAIDWPSRIVLVANQMSDEIVTFRIDEATGELDELVTTPTEGGPAFVGVFEQAAPL